MKLLENTIRTSFTKIRIRNKFNNKDETYKKIQERKEVVKKLRRAQSASEQHRLEDQFKAIEKEISEEYHKKQIKKVQENLDAITDSDGKVNTAGAWRLRRKLYPKPLEQLTAKLDTEGNMVTNPVTIKDIYIYIYLEAFVERLRHREMVPELYNLKVLREQLFQERLELAKRNKSPAWTMDNLDDVLKKLKKGKACRMG